MSKTMIEATAEAVAERTEDAGKKIGRAAGWTFVATVAVHLLTTYREVTVLWALRGLARFATSEGKAPGFFATLFLDSARNYDTAWTWLLGIGS